MEGDKTETVLDRSVTEIKQVLPDYDGDLPTLLEEEKQGKNRKTAKQAIQKEMKRRGEQPPQGIPTPEFSGVELPDVSKRDVAVLGVILALTGVFLFSMYQSTTLTSPEELYDWMTDTASQNTGVCANFSQRFADANLTAKKRVDTCECFNAENVPEDAIVKEQLVREHADLKAIVVCTVNGEKISFGYWRSPTGNGTATVQ